MQVSSHVSHFRANIFWTSNWKRQDLRLLLSKMVAYDDANPDRSSSEGSACTPSRRCIRNRPWSSRSVHASRSHLSLNIRRCLQTYAFERTHTHTHTHKHTHTYTHTQTHRHAHLNITRWSRMNAMKTTIINYSMHDVRTVESLDDLFRIPLQPLLSGISSWPSGHWQEYDPIVLMQCPPRHRVGSREHSSMSAGGKESLNRITSRIWQAFKNSETVTHYNMIIVF